MPQWAYAAIDNATHQGLVHNYPNIRYLKPNDKATRATVVATLYQARVHMGKAATYTNPYLVKH